MASGVEDTETSTKAMIQARLKICCSPTRGVPFQSHAHVRTTQPKTMKRNPRAEELPVSRSVREGGAEEAARGLAIAGRRTTVHRRTRRVLVLAPHVLRDSCFGRRVCLSALCRGTARKTRVCAEAKGAKVGGGARRGATAACGAALRGAPPHRRGREAERAQRARVCTSTVYETRGCRQTKMPACCLRHFFRLCTHSNWACGVFIFTSHFSITKKRSMRCVFFSLQLQYHKEAQHAVF